MEYKNIGSLKIGLTRTRIFEANEPTAAIKDVKSNSLGTLLITLGIKNYKNWLNYVGTYFGPKLIWNLDSIFLYQYALENKH